MIRDQKVQIGGKSHYQKWAESQGVPIIKDFYVRDLRTVELQPWAWKGGKGAILNLIGTGDANDSYIVEIAPGKNLAPQRVLFEEMYFVLSGTGSTSVWNNEGKKITFEWQEGSLFSPPINTFRQHFNGSGSKPARLYAVTSAPVLINLFRNIEFVTSNSFAFTDRFDEDPESFSGKGEQYPVGAYQVWDTNFIPDVRTIPLYVRNNRGAGGSFLGIELGENSMTAHISEFPVGTYKKAHRHGPGAHVVVIGGHGYSLMWPEGSPIKRFDWGDCSVIVPPERWFHQHFNNGNSPARYLALRWGSRKFPRPWGQNFGTDKSVKDGGDQIEYADEDPAIHQQFKDELAKIGATSKMDSVFKITS